MKKRKKLSYNGFTVTKWQFTPVNPIKVYNGKPIKGFRKNIKDYKDFVVYVSKLRVYIGVYLVRKKGK